MALDDRCPPACGQILSLSFAEALARIEADLLCAEAAASNYRLHEACEPGEDLRKDYRSVLHQSSGSRGARKNWRYLMQRRIGVSWQEQNPALVWLDDKVAQVGLTAELCEGQHWHLPVYAHAATGDAAAEARLCTVVCDCVARNEPVVIKPRHGSNSEDVHVWPQPKEAGEAPLLASVASALQAWHESWAKESWNQNAVPKGALLQPMYAAMSALGARGELDSKVLHSLSTMLWVFRSGDVHFWDEKSRRAWKKEKRRSRLCDDRLPPEVLKALQDALRTHWPCICSVSEQLARGIGLDELRVDWLLGDDKWGPRIGELTYVGSFAPEVFPVSERLAQTFAAGHCRREGRL
eukprot:TRINITY_DN14726_c0_g1_i4.p1 TRINITY_DN14726_c0_g1~~TRINITY_DN14726_c0_g1_i4.p1  ORF type:complete len:352 (-),score=63.81 TRINITY_DN14726_c0_g1_i4:8-1063(-)